MKKYYILSFILVFIGIVIFAQDTAPINKAASSTAINIANQYPDYPATPGDIYDIFFLTGGNVNQTLRGFVDTEYNIDLSFIGKVNVKGLIYSDVQKILKNKILSAYPGSIVNVIIASPGKFRITLLGEVKKAQIIESMSLTTLEQIIADKTTPYASFRDIEIRSEDGSIGVYDLFQFTRYANKKHNPYLKPNDVITIRPYKRTVTITGEVRRPGAYQLLETDTLDQIINVYADGFTKLSDNNRIIIQKVLGKNENFNDRNIIIDTDKRELNLVEITDFDKIIVPSRIAYNSHVELSGNVMRPGNYELVAGDTLHDLIYTYGDGFNKIADTTRIVLGRLLSDFEEVEREKIIINTDVDDLQSIILRDFDTIDIPKILIETKNVTLNGQVKTPGAFELVEGDTLDDLINIYGHGFNKVADTTRIVLGRLLSDSEEIEREKIIINTEIDDLKSYILRDFDTVDIPKILIETRNVTLGGQVKTPGTFELVEGDTLDDLINIYGHGFNKIAEISRIEIQRILDSGDGNYKEETFYIDGTKDNLKSILLSDFDKVNVLNKSVYSSKVIIQGAISPLNAADSISDSAVQVGITVSNKIPVPIIEGNRVSTVLTKMNGTFNLSSSLEEAFILRGDEKINVNLVEVMSSIDSEDDIVMLNKDILIVPFKQLLVYIAGSVNESKAVPFIENRSALYYIGLAGGMDRSENLFGTYSVRNVYGEKLPKDIIISPEDIIWVNRDHPMSYIEEYAGWATTIISTAIISYQLMNINSYLSSSN